MALAEKQKSRLDKLDFSKGGGFSDFITDRVKAEAADSKFLFVGLGGKGCNTVASIKTDVYKKLKCNEAKKRPDNFEYLIVDTDRNSIEHLVRGNFGEVGLSNSPDDNETCQLYDENAAKKLLPGNKHLIPDSITEWMSPTMNQQLQGEGAGGIRQAGRYLLFGEEAFTKVEKTLTHKLDHLHSMIIDPEKEKLIVYVFAGVSGGTGSGTVIDMPYIIREICNKYAWSVKVYGYVFLPDTYPKEATGNHLRYNSYAALKEIDMLMNIGLMDGAAHFKATYTPFFKVDSVERIFDSCVLISGKRNTGLVPKPDKFSRRVVVDNIINLVTKNETTDGFLANSFLDNSPTEIQNKVTMLPKETIPKNADYQYTVIGTGALVMPLEQILAYMAHGTMEMMMQAWDKHAEQKDVEALLGKIHMQPQDQANGIIAKSKVPLMQYTKGIGGPANKNQVIDDTLFNTIKQYWLGQNVALYDAWDVAKNECLERIINDLRDYYYNMFKDPEYGIYFLKELLSFRVIDGQSINGVYQRISEEYMKSINGFIGGQETMQAQIDNRMKEIKAELDKPLCLMSGGLIEEYRECCVAKLVSDNMIDLYSDLVKSCMKQILSFLETKMNELQSYIDVFTYMKDVVDRNYISVMNGTVPQAEYAGKLMDFSNKTDEPTQKVIAYLDGMLRSKNPEGIVSALEERIIHTEDKWVHSTEDFDPMSTFVKFLEDQYVEIPNLTIEKFIQLKYGTDGFSLGMDSICQELKNKAEVIFPTSPVFSLTSLASKNYVVVPAGALDVTSNMKAFAASNGATVSMSNDMNSMYWYNLIIGVPLFALRDIEDYETLYENNNISGMHMWESAKANWKDFPALSNQMIWPSPDFNRREKQMAEDVKQNVSLFLKSGLVYQNPVTDLYQAFVLPENDASFSADKILEWCKAEYLTAPLTNAEGLIDSGVPFIQQMSEQNHFTEYRVNIPSVYMDVTDENVYKLLRMNYFLYQKLVATYELYKECKAIIDEANSGSLEQRALLKSTTRFYDYARTGIIQITEDAVILEKKNGEQEEIMYFDDFGATENQFFVYYSVQKFMEKYEEDELEELDEYKTELTSDHSEEAKTKYRALSDQWMEECTKARDSLKKLDTKKALEKAGQSNLIGKLADFYDAMLGMKKGR